MSTGTVLFHATMLQLTKRTEYGLIALVHMADKGDAPVSVREVSEHYPIPRRLLAEVLKDLCRANLVESQRGATGGYLLARPAERITLGEVVTVLEGRPSLASCEILDPARHLECGIEPLCPIRNPLHQLRESIWQLLDRTTLRSLVRAPRRNLQLAIGHAAAHQDVGSTETLLS
jgi:Rrf2 family nitric oxide-sensitive transcriptional repressor